MGMSSSQARLLTLTARQHDVEWRAQKLQADKLQMANDSDHVYNQYLSALSTTKIQAQVSDLFNGDSFVDATLAMLQNGKNPSYNDVTSKKTLFLQDIKTGQLLISRAYATANNLNASKQYNSFDDYMQKEQGLTKPGFTHKTLPYNPSTYSSPNFTENAVKTYIYSVDTSKVLSIKGVNNTINNDSINLEYSYAPEANADALKLSSYASFNNTHNSVPANSIVLNASTTSITAGGNYVINSKAGLQKLLELATKENTTGTTFTLSEDISLDSINWTGINNFAGTFNGNGYTISGLTGSQGLFANTEVGATVKNVRLENVDINGNSAYVGGLIGYANGTNVTNIAIDGGSVKNTNNTALDTSTKTSITGTCGTGGVIGGYYENGTNIKAECSNVYSRVDVTGQNATGGLIGSIVQQYSGTGVFDLKNAYVMGNVTGQDSVGGLVGWAYYDQDSSNDVTDIVNCLTIGSVAGSDNVGGLVGTLQYWGDNNDKCEINGCKILENISSAGSVGEILGNASMVSPSSYSDNAIIHLNNVVYRENEGLDVYGTLSSDGSETLEQLKSYVDSASSGVSTVDDTTYVPSLETIKNTIIAAFIKSGEINFSSDDLETKIDNFLNDIAEIQEGEETEELEISDENLIKLYNLNDKLYNYITTGNEEEFVSNLYDVINGTSNFDDFKASLTTDIDFVKIAQKEDIKEVYHINSIDKADMRVPSASDIKATLTAAYQKHTNNPNSLTNAAAIAQVDAFYNSIQDDVYTLAKVNEVVNEYINNNYSKLTSESYSSDLEQIMYAIRQGTTSLNLTELKFITDLENKYEGLDIKDKDENGNYKYINIQQNGASQGIAYRYKLNNEYTYLQGSESSRGIIVEYGTSEELSGYDCTYDWNYDNSEISQAYQNYLLSKIGYVIIGDDTQSTDYDGKKMDESSTWLTNVINCGVAQFVDMEDIKSIINEINAITNGNQKLEDKELAIKNIITQNIKNTSIANEVSLQEVTDTDAIKRAEATYEAQMRKINRKETRIDNELSELETERNAIKTEQEELKSVIKNNVDMTFKLFS